MRNLQQVLTTQGVYTGPITGYFGPLTQAGVERFQTKYGIDPVGEVGPITRAKLNSFASGLFSAENQGLQDQINNLQSKLDALTAASAASTS
ncbi:MAG: peptidoglycan-binding domain-containing protein, partial [Candidatus Liptonbacteria bacterium]|nr:peptidoglycan-binding domain-containing protein [Candidatus Liptonbacteria bacterium]